MSTKTCTKHKHFPVLIRHVTFHKNGLRGEITSKDTYGVVAIASQDSSSTKKSSSMGGGRGLFLRRHHTTKFYCYYLLPKPDIFAPDAEGISPREIMR